jgi:hypothetical protein
MNLKSYILALALSAFGTRAALAEIAVPRLAAELAREQDHNAAALEFRRLALAGASADERGGYYWLAGHQYMRAGDSQRSNEMLDRAEAAASALIGPASLLRAENALRQRDPEAASFYFESFGATDADAARYAARRLAAIRLRAGDIDAAERLLTADDPGHEPGLAAIADYRSGRDKSPALGGLLGILPGLGHAYSGEYANGLRCLILNAVFIYGMVETAEDEEWGAFAVITFFELTWYSGSIYGGIDAAHRHNRGRLEDSISAIEGQSHYSPKWELAPTIGIEFRF